MVGGVVKSGEYVNMGHNDVEFIMPNKQTKFICEVKDYMISAINMTEDEAINYALRVWQTHEWLIGKLSEIMYEDVHGEWHDKDWWDGNDRTRSKTGLGKDT